MKNNFNFKYLAEKIKLSSEEKDFHREEIIKLVQDCPPVCAKPVKVSDEIESLLKIKERV